MTMSGSWQYQESSATVPVGLDSSATSNGSDPISRRVQAREIVAKAWQQSLAELVALGQQSLEWKELWRQHNEPQQDADPFKTSLEGLMKFVLTVRDRFIDEAWFQAAGEDLGLWDEASQKALAEVRRQQADRLKAEQEQREKEERDRRANEEAEAAKQAAEKVAAEEAAAKQAAEKQHALQQMATQLQQLQEQAIAAEAAKMAQYQAQMAVHQAEMLAEQTQRSEQSQALQQIALQKQIMDEAEKAAKTAAAQHGGFVGLFARFDEKKGFGFIECSESKAVHGRDIFLLKSLRADAEPGDIVSFEVEQGEKGLPQARGVKVLRELSQHRRLIMTWQQVYTGAIVTPAPTGKRFREEDFPIDTAQFADQAKVFHGVVNKYDTEKGYGFLECHETYELYNRSVFIHKAQWVDGLQLGDVVCFKVELNDKGWPQARDVVRNDELTIQRRQQTEAQAAATAWQEAAAQQAQQAAAQQAAVQQVQQAAQLSAAIGMAHLQGTAAAAPGALPVPAAAPGFGIPAPGAALPALTAGLPAPTAGLPAPAPGLPALTAGLPAPTPGLLAPSVPFQDFYGGSAGGGGAVLDQSQGGTTGSLPLTLMTPGPEVKKPRTG